MPLDFSKIGQPCELHELTGCSICSGLDKKLAAEEFEVPAHGYQIEARWAGKCPKCGEEWPVGQAIYLTSASVWICCP